MWEERAEQDSGGGQADGRRDHDRQTNTEILSGLPDIWVGHGGRSRSGAALGTWTLLTE